MNSDQLVHLGNDYRSKDQYNDALKYYAQAFVNDPLNVDAWNNYGNVLREIGEPKRAKPFLEHACVVKPDFVTAQFNLSIAALLAGDYDYGWKQYEWRWQYEHLAGTKPQTSRPEWQGEDLKGKTILVWAEQGLGDTIQFSRFLYDLHVKGAEILFVCMSGLVPLFQPSYVIKQCTDDPNTLGDFDYWIPMMSLPRVLGVTLENIRHDLSYVESQTEYISQWSERLGPKNNMRIGVCWSGRKDNWVNKYKGVPVEYFVELANKFPQHDWISLQAEAYDHEDEKIKNSNIKTFPGTINTWADTAGLVHHLDLVISIDTSVAHLAGAMGRPTWIPLTKFAVDWRWGLGVNRTPWYPSAMLFRQSDFGEWTDVFTSMERYLKLFKI